MSAPLRLVIFDVDGTLVDSQGDIVAAMGAAFASVGQEAPARAQVLGIVGLSLDVAMPLLAPGLGPDLHARMVQAYKDAYNGLRVAHGAASSPLFPGALEALRGLAAQDDILLGVATGKSKRGLDRLIENHGLEGMFVTQQVADHHPSKPHPSMILAALSETGVAPRDAVMIGDTSFDLEMARAAGIAAIGVSWGYHKVDQLVGAERIIDRFDQLSDALVQIWEKTA